MIHLWRAAALSAALVSAAASSGYGGPWPQEVPKPPQGSAFRSGVELVSMNVTVTDAASRYVTDLGPDDFSVYEDGVKQDIAFFNRTNLPLAVSLLLDTSASMEDKIRTAQTAAVGFAERLRPQDEAQLIDFDSRVTIIAPFTNNSADLARAIKSTTAGGSTSLFNAVYIALKELKRTRARSAEELRRQAIVMLSDGEDTSSLVSFEEVLDVAKRSETAIYAIGLRSRDPLTGKAFNEADYVLRQLTSQTGGRVFFPERAEELPAVYEQISHELSSQYSMGYTSRNPRNDGRWRRLVVRVARPGATARTKQGYYAPGS